MFTIKLYDHHGFRHIILPAEAFSVIADDGAFEITVHGPKESERYDVAAEGSREVPVGSRLWAQAFISNAAGKTIASYREEMAPPKRPAKELQRQEVTK